MLLDPLLLSTGEGDSGGVGSAIVSVVTSLPSQMILTSQYTGVLFCTCPAIVLPLLSFLCSFQQIQHKLAEVQANDFAFLLISCYMV
jgi:hypothetical protein